MIITPNGGCARNLLEYAEHISSIYCIADGKPDSSTAYGYPIMTRDSAISPEYKYVILSSQYYQEIRDEYIKLGVNSNQILPYFNFDTRIHYNYSLEKYFDWLNINEKNINFIYDALADNTSRESYINLLLGLENVSAEHFLNSCLYSKTEDPDYFSYNDILILTENEKYLDVGAYDGDTLKSFLECVNKFDYIYAFEPDRELYKKLHEYEAANIKCFDYAIGESIGKCQLINNDNKYANKIESTGTGDVNICSIDSLEMPFSLLKISVYGENNKMSIIRGAEKLIRTHRPKIVIQMERQDNDIISIPLELLKYQDYKIYLRTAVYQQNNTLKLNNLIIAV